MSSKGLTNSSVGRKVAMALSAFFLMIFLLQHFIINLTSVFSADIFNEISHFMGTNAFVQFLMQPILIFAVAFHFIMGFVLEIKNKQARENKYIQNNGAANSTWMSRNMIISGGVILLFLALHFIDFWLPEVNTKFIQGDWSGTITGEGEYRYYTELTHKFTNPIRVAVYAIAFIFLSLHLLHGFGSAFQSVGANNKYIDALKKFGVAYSIIIPLGFIMIALYHFLNH